MAVTEIFKNIEKVIYLKKYILNKKNIQLGIPSD